MLIEGERFIKRSLAKDPEDVGVLQTNNGLLIFLTRTERKLGNMEAGQRALPRSDGVRGEPVSQEQEREDSRCR